MILFYSFIILATILAVLGLIADIRNNIKVKYIGYLFDKQWLIDHGKDLKEFEAFNIVRGRNLGSTVSRQTLEREYNKKLPNKVELGRVY